METVAERQAFQRRDNEPRGGGGENRTENDGANPSVPLDPTSAGDMIDVINWANAAATARSGYTVGMDNQSNDGLISAYKLRRQHGLDLTSLDFGGAQNVLGAVVFAPGAAPLAITVSPSTFTARTGTVPAAGTEIAQAEVSSGDGKPVTFTIGGSNPDPNLTINPSTGAITSQGDSAAEGNNY